ncbi:serine hydrolase FSH [Hypoxylon rubiginosum]|uniref:Serine hydrolase FSH n=1 Tax=Hypoxylon rubiginosum TaxID=110542 RepID=A0ACC0CZW6_9PEZI|nr:serine hydrolase FSH [Hypoxylon rubiginosum]
MAESLDKTLPVILCIHGHGTNSTIFRHQSRNITQVLQNKFSFVFAESPIETSQPGTGVLPYFAHVKPYRRWHHDDAAVGSFDVTAEDVARERKLVRDMLAEHVQRHQPVGVIAFSQGTRVASALCLDPELGTGIRFIVQICGFVEALPLSSGPLEPRVLDMPSVHVQGTNDLWTAKQARLAKKSCFDPARARTIKFRGGHDVPVAMPDVVKITNEIVAVYESLPPV